MDATFTNEPRVGIGAIVRRDRELLLGMRAGGLGPGVWGLPGGKLDPGEHPVDCAARELEEETGLVATGFEPVWFWTNNLFPADDAHYITLYVLCDYAGGTPQRREPDKCLEWRWFPWSALPSPTYEGLSELQAALPTLL